MNWGIYGWQTYLQIFITFLVIFEFFAFECARAKYEYDEYVIEEIHFSFSRRKKEKITKIIYVSLDRAVNRFQCHRYRR